MVAVCVMPAPLAVTVIVDVPVVAVLVAVNVSVELPLPGAGRGFGLNVALTPEGRPETVREIAELNPPLTVVESVLLPEVPCVMLSEVGEAVRLKLGVTCCQTSVMAAALAALPACVKPYRSSSVRRILKWLMFSANCPCLTIGPKNIVGIWLLPELLSSSQVTIRRLL